MDIACVDIRDYPRDDFDEKNETFEAVEGEDPRPTQTGHAGNETRGKHRHRWTRQFEVAIKSIGVIAFFLSCVALWPAVTSASDTKMATRLAKWTSLKEFLEFCESHQFNTSGCVAVRNMTLLPPPGFRNSISRRLPEQNMTLWVAPDMQLNAQKTYFLALIRVLYPAIGLLVILRYLKTRYPQYRSTISHWLSPITRSITGLRSEMRCGKGIRISNSDHRYGNHLLVTCTPSRDNITHPNFNSTTEVSVQGTGATFIKTSNNNSSRRRNILRNRHNHHHSSRKGNHVLGDMDDSSSDELFHPRQSGGVGGESRRSLRVRFRRRSGGKPAPCDGGVHNLKMA